MSLTLRVSYPATDGTMPESVELEWADGVPDAATVLPLLERLLSAPAEHRAGLFPTLTAAAAAPDSGPYSLTHAAKRGDILGLCGDGFVRNAGDPRAAGKLFAAGVAGENLLPETRIVLRDGRWFSGTETA